MLNVRPFLARLSWLAKGCNKNVKLKNMAKKLTWSVIIPRNIFLNFEFDSEWL